MSQPPEDPKPARKPVTARTLLLWAAPVLAGLLVLALALAMNWEPWFGYAAVIAGVLGALMMAGEHFGVRGE
jgi:fatty acid desaturase